MSRVDKIFDLPKRMVVRRSITCLSWDTMSKLGVPVESLVISDIVIVQIKDSINV